MQWHNNDNQRIKTKSNRFQYISNTRFKLKSMHRSIRRAAAFQ